jgi:hypothetical protein
VSGRVVTGGVPRQLANSWADFDPCLKLIPPLADEFGSGERAERMRQWALWHRYLRAEGVPACAHGLYLMNACPADSVLDGCAGAGFDHTTVWVPADRPYEPFILTQPYVDEVPASLAAYAGAHGLAVSASPRLGDGWHHHNVLPIRLTAGDTGHASWPIGTRAVVLTAAFPMDWPDVTGPAWWQEWAS